MKKFFCNRIVQLIITALIFGYIGAVVGYSINLPENKTSNSFRQPEVANKEDITPIKLNEYVNTERTKNGLLPLKFDANLSAAAKDKCHDMVDKNYWSHKTSDGQEPWIFMKAEGYRYEYAGENLAYGFATNKKVVDSWISSPEHYENIVKPNYVDVGYGICDSGNFMGEGRQTLIVQFFGSTQ